MGVVCGVCMEVIYLAADSPSPDGQRGCDGAFGEYGVTAGKIEVLLEVGGFDNDGDVEITTIQAHNNIQKRVHWRRRLVVVISTPPSNT